MSFHVGEQQSQCADPVCKLAIMKGYTAHIYENFEGELKEFNFSWIHSAEIRRQLLLLWYLK